VNPSDVRRCGKISTGDMTDTMHGLVNSQARGTTVVSRDKRCCFCLTFRIGLIFISLTNCFLYTAFFQWYVTSKRFGDFDNADITYNYLDISVFVIFLLQFFVNLLLLVGAVRRIPNQGFPWIGVNAVFCIICMIGIVVTIIWGTNKLGLNNNEFITVLVILGLITATNLFCVIVVFQFRHSTLFEEIIERERILVLVPETGQMCGPLPPPSYDEIVKQDYKLQFEDGLPEYEAAIAMAMASSCRNEKEVSKSAQET